MKIERDEDYRRILLDTLRDRLGVGRRRDGIHVSDLILCMRKSWAERQIGAVSEATDPTIISWLRGLSHEEMVAEGVRQVRSSYCFSCQKLNLDGFSYRCPSCGDFLLIGTMDWLTVDGVDMIPVEMKSTLKSARKTLEAGDMHWYMDQVKSYMAMHNVEYGRIVINHVMGSYKRYDANIRSGGPEAELVVYRVEWENEDEKRRWLDALAIRLQRVVGDDMPLLDEVSPVYGFICDYCTVGQQLPDGSRCERWPWVQRWDGKWVREGSKADTPPPEVELALVEGEDNSDDD